MLRKFELTSHESHDWCPPLGIFFEDGLFKCRTCPNVKLNGVEPLTAHVTGKKHCKALSRWIFGMDMTNDGLSDSSLPPNTFFEGGLYKCKMCPRVTIDNAITLKAHIEGKKHRNKALSCQEASPETLTTNCSLPTNIFVEGGAFKCKVCPNASFTAVTQVKSHVEGKKHRNKAQLLHDASSNKPLDCSLPPNTYFEGGLYKCKMCPKVTIQNAITYKAHIVGKKHRNKALSCQEASPKTLTTNCSLPTNIFVEGGAFKCKVCPNASFTAITQVKSHVEGKKHRKAQFLHDALSDKLLDCSLPPNTYFEGGLYKCKMCPKVTIDNAITLKAHIEGKKHRNKALSCQEASPKTLTTNCSLPTNIFVEGGAFKCEVCPNASFTAITQVKSHVEGKKHRKAQLLYDASSNKLLDCSLSPNAYFEGGLYKSGISPNVSIDGIVTPARAHVEEKQNCNALSHNKGLSNDFCDCSLPPSIFVEGGTFKCKICPNKVSLIGVKALRAHIEGKKNRKALSRSEPLSNEFRDFSFPPHTFLEAAGVFKCRICPSHAITDFVHLMAHVMGKKHRKALSFHEALWNDYCLLPLNTFLDSGLFKCRVCPSVSINGIIPLKAHMEGKKHQKILLKQQKVFPNKLSNYPPIVAVTDGSYSLKTSPPTQVNPVPITEEYFIGSDGSYKCKVCPDFKVNGVEPLKEHLKCYRHQKALLEWIENGRNNISNLTSPILISGKSMSSFLTTCETVGQSVEVEKKLMKAFTHEMPCGFSYEKVEMLSFADKVDAASSHFVLVGVDDDLPNLLCLL